MKKTLLFWSGLIAIGVITGCCMTIVPRTQQHDHNIVNDMQSSTVAFVSKGLGSGVVGVYCSGVWIAKDKILTADHCARAEIEHKLKISAESGPLQLSIVRLIEADYIISFITNNDSLGFQREPAIVRLAVVKKFDFEHDLAILVIKDDESIPDHEIANLAEQSPDVGEEIHLMGHPLGLSWTYGHGYVAAYREEQFIASINKLGPWLQGSVPGWHGNSGGGVFNSEGNLVGIASFIVPAPNTLMFVHIATIKNFLNRNVL